jgi:HK97 family phage prohead protease
MEVQFNFNADFVKHYVEKEQNEEKWIVEGFCATDDFDLQGDIISPEALKGSEKDLVQNSTVLFNHKSDTPIGKVIEAKAQKHGLWVKVLISKTVPEYWQKIKEGVLNKFSISGKIIRAVKEWVEKLNRIANVIKEMYLTECSVVSLPANPRARTLCWYVTKALQDYEAKGGEIEMAEKEGLATQRTLLELEEEEIGEEEGKPQIKKDEGPPKEEKKPEEEKKK